MGKKRKKRRALSTIIDLFLTKLIKNCNTVPFVMTQYEGRYSSDFTGMMKLGPIIFPVYQAVVFIYKTAK